MQHPLEPESVEGLGPKSSKTLNHSLLRPGLGFRVYGRNPKPNPKLSKLALYHSTGGLVREGDPL